MNQHHTLGFIFLLINHFCLNLYLSCKYRLMTKYQNTILKKYILWALGQCNSNPCLALLRTPIYDIRVMFAMQGSVFAHVVMVIMWVWLHGGHLPPVFHFLFALSWWECIASGLPCTCLKGYTHSILFY